MNRRTSRQFLRLWALLAMFLAMGAVAVFSLFVGFQIRSNQYDQSSELKFAAILSSFDLNGDKRISTTEFLAPTRDNYASHWLTTIVVNSYWRDQIAPDDIMSIYISAETGDWSSGLSVRFGTVFSQMDADNDGFVDERELKRWVSVRGA